MIALLVLLARFTIPETQTWLDANRNGATTSAPKVRVRDILTGPYARLFWGLLGFYALTNLAANTMGQFTTYIWVNVVGVDVQLASLIGLVSLPVFLLFGLWFMRIVDTRYRFVYFTAGAIAYAASFFIPALFGFSFATMMTYTILNGIGGAFAFEGIMKVWTQESFPTMVRATAQGTILAVARFSAAILAVWTPLMLNSGPQLMFAGLGLVVTVGVTIAWVVFHNAPRNQFDTKSETLADSVVPAAAVEA